MMVPQGNVRSLLQGVVMMVATRLMICISVLASAGVAIAFEPTMPEVLPDLPIWQGNKLTPGQPFPARVKAIGGSWVGYTLLVEEITDNKPVRCCLASVGYQQSSYRVLPSAEGRRVMKHPHMHATFFDPMVEVDRFRWDNGLYKIGHNFGKEDSLRQWYRTRQNEREGGQSDAR